MKTLLLTLLFLSGQLLLAQKVSISVVQDLNFGDFYLAQDSETATVEVSADGIWNYTGNVYQVNSSHHPAIFLISTESLDPIKIQIHRNPSNMRNDTGVNLALSTKETNTQVYSIHKGAPLRLPVGGTLDIKEGATQYTGKFKGDLSLWVTVLNE